MIDCISEKTCFLLPAYGKFCKFTVDVQYNAGWYSLIQRLYDSESLEVYAGWVEGSSVYMQVFFIEVAYTV